MLERVIFSGGSELGQATEAAIADAERGDVTLHFGPTDEHHQSGALRKGGWLAGGVTDAGTMAIVPAMTGMRYQIDTYSKGPKSLRWAYLLGLGHDGQAMKKGDELKYRYLAVSVSGRAAAADNLPHGIGAAFGLGENSPAPLTVDVGRLMSSEVFITASADNHEFVAKFNPTPLFINRPLRIEGIDDNGCAAVYAMTGESSQRRFRFVGVFEGAAWLQFDTDQGPTLWIGNPFYADDDRLRLTLVADGLPPDEKPYLEVHNPTDVAVRTTLHSPPHTPIYGGYRRQVAVPAGDSVSVQLK